MKTKLEEINEELNKMLAIKQEKELFERKLQQLQLDKVAEQEKQQKEHQQEVDSEARVLKKEGLGRGVPYLHCFKCNAELPIIKLRETVGEDASSAWFSLDAICPKCSEQVKAKYQENNNIAKVVTFGLVKETHSSNYKDMRS